MSMFSFSRRAVCALAFIATACGGGASSNAGSPASGTAGTTGCSPIGSVPTALRTCRAWITYAPPRPFDPTSGVFPTEAQLRTSLQAAAAEGWRGIVTYSLDGSLALIPRPAKQAGFTHVIAGLFGFDAAQLARERTAALSPLAHIDAFVLGNEGLMTRYGRAELEAEITSLKAATGRPVTTSESIDRYEADATLALVGDWVFANVQACVGGIRTIPAAVQDRLAKFEALQRQAPGRSVILHDAWWPTCSDPAASEVNQTEFFRRIAATPVKCVFGELADQYYKTSEGRQGVCWGLHTDTGVPKAAVQGLDAVYTRAY